MSDQEESMIMEFVSRHKKDSTLRWILQLLILAVVTISGGYFWLYSDHHNDSRYVSIPSYLDDVKRQNEAIQTINQNLAAANTQRSLEHDILQDVKNDIKWMRSQTKP